MTRFFTFLLFVILTFTAPARAATPELTLTIQSAVSEALAHNPDIERFRERLNEGEKQISFAYAQILPNLAFSGVANLQKDASNSNRALFGGDAYNVYQAQFTLTQPLYVGGALSSALSVAKKDLEIRHRDLEIAERDLTTTIIQAFYSVIANRQAFEMLQQTRKVQEEALSTAQRYRNIGRSQLIDVLQIKTQIALLNPRIATAENQMKSAASQLATLLHQNQVQALTLKGSLSAIDTKAITTLLSDRKSLPEVERSLTTISQFEDRTDVVLAPYNPSLSLVGSIGRNAYAPGDLFNDFSTAWSVGLKLSVPLFNGLASIQQRGILSSEEKQLNLAHAQLLDVTGYNRIQAERDLDTATTVLNSSQEASELSDDALKEAQRDYRLQTINYLQFLTSQQNNLDAKLNFIQAKNNFLLASARYCNASGIPIARFVKLLEAKE